MSTADECEDPSKAQVLSPEGAEGNSSRLCRVNRLSTTELYDTFALANAKEVMTRNQAITRGFDEERAYVLRKAGRQAAREKWDFCRGRVLDLMLSHYRRTRCPSCRKDHSKAVACEDVPQNSEWHPTTAATAGRGMVKVNDNSGEEKGRFPSAQQTSEGCQAKTSKKGTGGGKSLAYPRKLAPGCATGGAHSNLSPKARRKRCNLPPRSGGWASPNPFALSTPYTFTTADAAARALLTGSPADQSSTIFDGNPLRSGGGDDRSGVVSPGLGPCPSSPLATTTTAPKPITPDLSNYGGRRVRGLREIGIEAPSVFLQSPSEILAQRGLPARPRPRLRPSTAPARMIAHLLSYANFSALDPGLSSSGGGEGPFGLDGQLLGNSTGKLQLGSSSNSSSSRPTSAALRGLVVIPSFPASSPTPHQPENQQQESSSSGGFGSNSGAVEGEDCTTPKEEGAAIPEAGAEDGNLVDDTVVDYLYKHPGVLLDYNKMAFPGSPVHKATLKRLGSPSGSPSSKTRPQSATQPQTPYTATTTIALVAEEPTGSPNGELKVESPGDASSNEVEHREDKEPSALTDSQPLQQLKGEKDEPDQALSGSSLEGDCLPPVSSPTPQQSRSIRSVNSSCENVGTLGQNEENLEEDEEKKRRGGQKEDAVEAQSQPDTTTTTRSRATGANTKSSTGGGGANGLGTSASSSSATAAVGAALLLSSSGSEERKEGLVQTEQSPTGRRRSVIPPLALDRPLCLAPIGPPLKKILNRLTTFSALPSPTVKTSGALSSGGGGGGGASPEDTRGNRKGTSPPPPVVPLLRGVPGVGLASPTVAGGPSTGLGRGGLPLPGPIPSSRHLGSTETSRARVRPRQRLVRKLVVHL